VTSFVEIRLDRRAFVAGGFAAGFGLALARSTSAQQATPAASPAAEFPRTIAHALGETTVPVPPIRIVAVSDFIDFDFLQTLGVEPVLYGFSNAWNSGAMPWQADAASLPSYDAAGDPDLELIAAAKPDLIVGMASVEAVYPQLSQIAPTIVLGWDTGWRAGLRMVAAATGLDGIAEEKIVETEEFIAAANLELAPIADKTLMVAFQYSDTFYIWGAETPASKLFLELGLNFAGGPEPFLTSASLEQVNLLNDAEIVLSVASDPDALAVQEASPLFQGLPAVRNGGYGVLDVVLARSLGDGLSPLSLPWGMPRFIELVTGLAHGQGKKLS
jgi:iron complex transport system substrate-binding protein